MSSFYKGMSRNTNPYTDPISPIGMCGIITACVVIVLLILILTF